MRDEYEVKPSFFNGIDSFGRMPCPGCKTPIVVITHVDKPGSPDGVTTVDVDLMPMAEHMVECADAQRERAR